MRAEPSEALRWLSCLLALLFVSSCGQWRRAGSPIAEWPGGRYAEPECDQVLCIPHHPRPAHACPRDRVDGTITERTLMAICQPRAVRGRSESYRFDWPDAAPAHAAFDDRAYRQLDAALLASAAAGRTYDRERAYAAALYAGLVTDLAQLRAEVAELGAGPEAQDAMAEMVERMREIPTVADGATEAERHIFHEVPRRMVAERRAEYAAFPDAYRQLDALVAEAERDISVGRANAMSVTHLEGIRRARLEACEHQCVEEPLVVRATEALVRLHVALGDDDRAGNERAAYAREGTYTATLAAAIHVAQLREIELLAGREREIAELVSRGMNEAAARERVGVAGEVRMPRRSIWRVPTTMPDHAPRR